MTKSRLAPILALAATALTTTAAAEHAFEKFRGKPGPTGWKAQVVCPDLDDHGPDGINFHDWDGDGDTDLFVNYEEGKFSRLYFNPGDGRRRDPWDDWIEFAHGKCEDSGIGDLDGDGDIDYVANGGWVYFNPGADRIRDAAAWTKMTLFDHEQRVPVVADVDGDGLDDLIVGAQAWFKQPVGGKHRAENWKKFELGKVKVKWPMNCLRSDIDGDGDIDLVVPDRRDEIFCYQNPGADRVTSPWPRKRLHPHTSMFIDLGDVDGDGDADLMIAGGAEGTERWKKKLTVLLRSDRDGDPSFHEIRIDQPCGNFPKGVKLVDLDGDPATSEIVVTPKQGDLWVATFSGDPTRAENWTATPLEIPGAETRKKMDNTYATDLDGDGDQDIVTTEENGGWGVVWFENPRK